MGGGGKTGETGSSKDLARLAKKFSKETKGLRKETISQMFEALTTGGVDARIPIINQAVERSKQATSASMRGLDETFAQSGLAGTPFAARAKTETAAQGRQAESQIPTQIVQQILQKIPGFVTGVNQVSVSGLGQAAGAESNLAAAQNQAMARIIGSMMPSWSFAPFGTPRKAI